MSPPAYKTVLYAVDKGRNVLQSVVTDSATYLLMISWPDIDNVAMSLYDIENRYVQVHDVLYVMCNRDLKA